jgi:hypothetical protein
MYRHKAVTLLGLLLCCMVNFAAAQVAETPRLLVSLEDGGALEVLDKQTNITWRQPPTDRWISDARAADGQIAFLLDNQYRVTVTVQDSTIDLTIGGEPSLPVEGLDYPAAFLPAAAGDNRLLLPNGTGLAIPFADKDAPHLERIAKTYHACIEQGGLMMPWIGVTNGSAGSLMLLDTPVDAQIKVERTDTGYSNRAVWLDEKGAMGYERSVRFVFTGGGTVSLCKWYRQYAMDNGWFVSLREKRKTNPTLDRFIGAMNLWISDWPDFSLFEDMKQAGIDKALVNYHVAEKPEGTVYRDGYYPTYEAMGRDFARQVQDLGYLAGRYDVYRTIFPPSRQSPRLWITRRMGYPEQCAVDAEGNIRPGFRARPGDTEILGHRCSWRQYELARLLIPYDVDRVGYDSRLIDTICAVNWNECYHPAHPVTRREDLDWRNKLLGFVTDMGQICGTEHLAYWAVPFCHYAEAPTTFSPFFAREIPRQNQLTTEPRDVPDIYRQLALNEKLRAPLWQLVFHDAAVVTGRWNWTPNRFTTDRDWEQETLIDLLHGNMPTIMLDKAEWAKKREGLLRTYNSVCTWNSATGYEKMINHEWLTADGAVQRTTYASGKSVTVNFGDAGFTLPSGNIVPARGYVRDGL